MHSSFVRGVVAATALALLPQPVAFRRLAHHPSDSTQGAIYVPLPDPARDVYGVAVIADPAQWRRAWAASMPGTPLPAVDFARETVAAISYGGQSGCHAATRHVVRAGAGRADTVWVGVRPDPRPRGRCDGGFYMADLVVLERAHAHVQWRALDRPRAGETIRPVFTTPLWPGIAPPST